MVTTCCPSFPHILKVVCNISPLGLLQPINSTTLVSWVRLSHGKEKVWVKFLHIVWLVRLCCTISVSLELCTVSHYSACMISLLTYEHPHHNLSLDKTQVKSLHPHQETSKCPLSACIVVCALHISSHLTVNPPSQYSRYFVPN